MIDAPSSTWFTVSPDWHWLIVLYFFFGGLAAGCFFLAALLDLFGRPEDRRLARIGYYVALPLIVVCGVLLILDLSRPLRFWHLLIENHTGQPIFKYWSPMSISSWALLAFGVFALFGFLGALHDAGRLRWEAARRFRPPGALGAVVAVVGALLGLYIAGYPGVMLAVTNRPVWADTPLLGMLLIISATSISAALMVLLAERSRQSIAGIAALHRMDEWLIALEFIVLVALVFSLGGAVRALLNVWGLLLVFGVVVLGMVLPLALSRRRDWLGERTMSAAAILVLAGEFILRTVIVFSPDAVTS